MLGQIEKLTCAKLGVCRTIFVCFIAKNECANIKNLGLTDIGTDVNGFLLLAYHECILHVLTLDHCYICHLFVCPLLVVLEGKVINA